MNFVEVVGLAKNLDKIVRELHKQNTYLRFIADEICKNEGHMDIHEIEPVVSKEESQNE
jgi:hypothetical protein